MKGNSVNTHKIIVSLVLCLMSLRLIDAAVPCGTASGSAGFVLNVGLLPGIPGAPYYSTISGGVATGFDPALATQVGKLLGYNKINFIGYPSVPAGLAALNAGAIDILAASNLNISALPLGFLGIVTDIARLDSNGQAFGWLLKNSCCVLAENIDAAITRLVITGVYAQILQAVRLAGLVPPGISLGYPVSDAGGIIGRLEQPFPFASNELGTIPAICSPSGANLVVSLPATNCISAFLQSNCTPTTTFNGATGQAPTD
jgi:ABC-type amino acid transport substrate-binding protein